MMTTKTSTVPPRATLSARPIQSNSEAPVQNEPAPSAGLGAPRTRLIVLNLIGGTAVLGSYVWGALARPDAFAALWGGVPEAARPIYTVNMFLAAGGYFLFSYFLVFAVSPERVRIAGRLGYGTIELLYALILIPSALWLPLTVAMVDAPHIALWGLIRLDLALVGLGSIGLFASIWLLEGESSRARMLALVGLLPFIFQTAVLDALIWPAYYPLVTH